MRDLGKTCWKVIPLSAGVVVASLCAAGCGGTGLSSGDVPSAVPPGVRADIERLSSPSYMVRAQAASRLGASRARVAVPLLIDALADEHECVRKSAAHSLGLIGGAGAVEPLVAAMRRGVPGAERALGRMAGRTGGPAIEPLIAALGDGDPDIRRRAARGLKEAGSERAIGPLIVALRDEDSWVRQEAAGALAGIGRPAVEPLLTVLVDEDHRARKAAATALGLARDPRAVPALITALGKLNPNPVRYEAMRALARMPEPATGPLVAAMASPDPMIRGGAAETLGRLKNRGAVPHLIAALGDAESNVRASAAIGLCRIPDPRAVEPLIAALKDESSSVRACAAGTLGEVGDRRGVEPLLAAMKDESRGARGQAAMALAKIGTPRALEPLLGAIRDQEAFVRQCAAIALGRLGDPSGVGPLIALFGDRNEWTEARLSAADSLASIGDERAVPPLIAALRDGDYRLAEAAVKALVRIGARAVAPLTPLLAHESPWVRQRAARALAKIADRSRRAGAR